MSELSAASVATRRGVATRESARAKSMFFVAMGAIMLALVFWAFAPTFFLRPFFGHADYADGPGLPVHVIGHGVLVSAWYVLFFTQSCLAFARRVDIHRRLGLAGVGLAAVLVPFSGFTVVLAIPRLTEHLATLRGISEAAARESLSGLVIGDFSTLFMFSMFVLFAIYYRKRPTTHKRLMLLASLSLMGPAFGIRPVESGFVFALPSWLNQTPLFRPHLIFAVVALVAYDLYSRHRVMRTTIWGSLAIAVWYVFGYIRTSTNLGATLYGWLFL